MSSKGKGNICGQCCDSEQVADIIACICELRNTIACVKDCLGGRICHETKDQILTCIILQEIQRIEDVINNPNFGLNEIKAEIIEINNILNNQLFGLKEIKNEVRFIENTLTNEAFGLREIKNEIIDIENLLGNISANNVFQIINTTIQSINNTINNPIFGLSEIKNEIRVIENAVLSPIFGLNEIKNEIRAIENAVFSPVFGLNEIKNEIRGIENTLGNISFNCDLAGFNQTLNNINNTVNLINNSVNNDLFGLNEIKNEIRLLVNQVTGESNEVTTGAVQRDRDSRQMILKAINTTPVNRTIQFIVWNYGACPANCFRTQNFTITPNCANEVEFTIASPPLTSPTNLQNYEITVSGIVPGVYVYTTTIGNDDRFSGANTYRSGDFLPRFSNRTCL